MKRNVLRLLVAVLIPVGVAIGAAACLGDEATEEVKDATAEVKDAAAAPAEGTVPTPPPPADAASEKPAPPPEPAAPSMSAEEKEILAVLGGQLGMYEKECAKGPKCLGAVKKAIKADLGKLTKAAGKIKKPSAEFVAQCKEQLKKRDDLLKKDKKVGGKAVKDFKAVDKALAKVCK